MKFSPKIPKEALILSLGLTLTACATKKPYQVNATPIHTSIVAPMAREIQRTAPGEIMDPGAEVFAQVPKRIIYLPEERTLTGRQSAEQVAAYSLVKIRENPESQNGLPTTVIMTDPSRNPDKGSRDIINMSITERGKPEEGTARILNVVEVSQIDRARGRIHQGETLKFVEETGWIGWIPKGNNTPPPQQVQIPKKLTTPTDKMLPPLQEEKPKATPLPDPVSDLNLNPGKANKDTNITPPKEGSQNIPPPLIPKKP